MLRFLKIAAVAAALTVIIGVAVALSIHWSGSTDGIAVTIDGERLDGLGVAVLFGALAAVGVMAAFIAVMAVIIGVTVLVPLVLAFVLIALVCALVFGLAPVVVPALLLVGACVLLVRWMKRQRAATPAATLNK